MSYETYDWLKQPKQVAYERNNALAIKSLKAAKIISLRAYRELVQRARGWKPEPLDVYVAMVRGHKRREFLLRKKYAMKAHNERIVRIYGLRRKK